MKNCCYEHMPVPPDGMIGPRISEISRVLRAMFNEAVQEEGLFAGQQHIIIMLEKEGGLTISRLSQALKLSAASVSVSIKRMEKAGFVEKKADANDARLTKIYLTEKGAGINEKIRQKMDAQENKISGGLSEEERIYLSRLLDKVISNLEKEEFADD